MGLTQRGRAGAERGQRLQRPFNRSPSSSPATARVLIIHGLEAVILRGPRLPSVTLQPPSVAPQPPSASPQPPSASPQPPSASPQPPSASPQPPSASPQPPFVTPQPPFVTLQPPFVTLQPPSITHQPRQHKRPPRRAPSGGRNNTWCRAWGRWISIGSAAGSPGRRTHPPRASEGCGRSCRRKSGCSCCSGASDWATRPGSHSAALSSAVVRP